MKRPPLFFQRWLALALLALLWAGVSSAAGPRDGIERTILPDDARLFYSTNQEPPWHGVPIPHWPNLPKIHWYDRLNPVWWLGNAEEPEPPAWYEPGNPHRHSDWHWRNPFTNFTYFVIGVADKDTRRYGRHPLVVGNPHGGWNVAVTRWTVVLLPFVDYKNTRMEFYLGWRERGNFGIKLNIHATPQPVNK